MNVSRYEETKQELLADPKVWAVTGVAGFIGSNLLEALLKLDQGVVGLDNFATGFLHNLEEVRSRVSEAQWSRFRFIEGDICSPEDCQEVCEGADYILHQAALGSVPRSLADPIASNATNVTGFLNILVASRSAGVPRFVYASSSSAYGSHPRLPKVEDVIGEPLSPYAVTKYVNELYAGVFGRCYGFTSIGLRYFNVFGPRQNPEGPYAAVIPKWTAAMIEDSNIFINGDGKTSRDFCFVENVVQANILAATTSNPKSLGQVYNVGVGEQTSLNDVFAELRRLIAVRFPRVKDIQPKYRDFREGDVRHSCANISKAKTLLQYAPSHVFTEGLEITVSRLLTQATYDK